MCSAILRGGSDSDAALDAVLETCEQLIQGLTGLRKVDTEFVDLSARQLQHLINAVQIGNEADIEAAANNPERTEDLRQRLEFVLQRYCGQQALIWTEYLYGSLLSSQRLKDLRKINPYLSEGGVTPVMDAVVATLLRSNRIGVCACVHVCMCVCVCVFVCVL